MSCGLDVLDSSSAAVPVKESICCALENPERGFLVPDTWGTKASLSSGVSSVAAARFGDAMLHSLCQEGEGAGRAAITLSFLCTPLPGPAR